MENKIQDRYLILEKMGSGSIGTVYKVRDELKDRILALKIFKGKKDDRESMETLQNEFQILSELKHPNLVEVYDFGVHKNGSPFFTMEFINGDNIFEYIKKSTNYEDEVKRVKNWKVKINIVYKIFFQIIEALVYIHSRGLIHGDLKPSNIMVLEFTRKGKSYPHVKLLDFGLSLIEKSAPSRVLSGTLEYMAPENLLGEPVHRGSDLYALGVILYELITDKSLYEFEDPEKLIQAHFSSEFPKPREFAPQISEEVEKIILHLLEQNPLDRYSDSYEFLVDFTRICGMESAIIDKNTVKNLVLSGKFVGRESVIIKLEKFYDNLKHRQNGFVLISGDLGIGKSRLTRHFKNKMQLAGTQVILTSSIEEEYLKALKDFTSQLVFLLGEKHPLAAKYEKEIKAIIPTRDIPIIESEGIQSSGIYDDKSSESSILNFSQNIEKTVIFKGLLDLLYELAKNKPLMIIFEDIHLSGNLLKEFLIYFGRMQQIHGKIGLIPEIFHPATNFLIPKTKDENETASRIHREILIIMTCRSDAEIGAIILEDFEKNFKDSDFFTHFILNPLTEEDIKKLVSGIIKGESGELDRVISHIHKQTGGNPLFIEEYFKFLIEEERLEFFKNGLRAKPELMLERLESSSSVREILRHRFEGLLPLEKEVLKWMAVFGISGKTKDISGLISGNLGITSLQLRKMINQLEVKQLIRKQEGNYKFHHGLIMEIAYSFIPDEQRKSLHLMIGNYFERIYENSIEENLEPLAYHFYHGRDLKKGLQYQLLAAKKLEKTGALLEAAGYYLRAVNFLDSDDSLEYSLKLRKKFEILKQKYQVLDLAGKRGEQETCVKELEEIAQKLEDKPFLIDAIILKIKYFSRIAKFNQVLKLSETGIYFSRDQNMPYQECLLRIQACHAMWQTGNYNDALKLAQIILNIAQDKGYRLEQGRAYDLMGLSHEMIEDYHSALECFEKALSIFQSLNEPTSLTVIYNHLGNVHSILMDFEKGIEFYNKALELSRKISFHRNIGAMHLNIGKSYSCLGFLEKAQEYLEKGLMIFQEENDILDQGIVHLSLGWNYCYSGNPEIAQRYFLKASDILASVKDILIELSSKYALSFALYQAGRYNESIEYTEKVLKICQEEYTSKTLLLELCAMVKGLNLIEMGKVSQAYDISKRAVSVLKTDKDLNYSEIWLVFFHYIITSRYEREVAWNRGEFLENDLWKRESVIFLKWAYDTVMRVSSSLSEPENKKTFLEKSYPAFEIVKEFISVSQNIQARNLLSLPSLEALYEISKNINSILNLDTLLNRILFLAVDTLKGERGLLALINDEGSLEIKAAVELSGDSLKDAHDVSISIIKDVSGTMKPVLTNRAFMDERFQSRKSIINLKICSVLAVPMFLKGSPVGVVYLDRRTKEESFTKEDIAFLEAFSNMASVSIDNAILHQRITRENIYLKTEVKDKFKFENFIGISPCMENVYRAMEAAMRTDAPVLIEGESGTGKELVAKAIHYNGLRREKRFFPVDCGAIPETLLESELFGYKKGAFTGAHIDKKGFFEEVDEGSLFLDEIGNTTVSFQAKLLRVLQEGEIRRIGESNIRQVNVRIIAATNVDLEENINAGKFREDLYYRLNVININLPPLRERKEDLPLLSEYFLEKSAKNLGMRKKILCEAVVQILVNYSWPGNIRELSNEMERITAFLEDREQIFPNDLHPRILKTVEKPGLKLLKTAHDMQIQENYEKTIKDQISHLPDWLLQNEIRSIEELEDWYIRLIFEKLNRNQLQTAKALKIGRSTLLRKLRLI